MKNNVKVQDDTQSLQSCVSVSVTDLRIGNLIHYNGNHKEIGKISLIVSDMVEALSYCQINYRRDKKHWLINLQPVKLTEDWLIAFGFKKYTGWDDMEFYCLLNDGGNSDRFELMATNQGYELPSGKICEFVHQLQNCYFFHELNGNELQVVDN